jgi:hypothetical protein
MKVNAGQSSSSMLKDTNGTENIPAIKGYNDNLITDLTEKANNLNSYYVSVFSYE